MDNAKNTQQKRRMTATRLSPVEWSVLLYPEVTELERQLDLLGDQLDDSFVSLRLFKDQLDRLPDATRDAAFALAWPEHPCFETLLAEISKWADRLRKPSKPVMVTTKIEVGDTIRWQIHPIGRAPEQHEGIVEKIETIGGPPDYLTVAKGTSSGISAHASCFTLVRKNEAWIDSLTPTPQQTEEDLFLVAALSDLTDQYQAFMAREKLELGSADEHVCDESLTEEQRRWIASFCNRWELAERWEHALTRRLKIQTTPERLKQFRVRYDGTEYPLLGFAMANDADTTTLDLLLAGEFGIPTPIPVHAGHEELTLLGSILDESTTDDAWWRCLCNNDPEYQGFIACDSQGKPQVDEGHSPLPEWDGKHYKCLQCGVYFGGKDNLEVRGPVGQRSS